MKNLTNSEVNQVNGGSAFYYTAMSAAYGAVIQPICTIPFAVACSIMLAPVGIPTAVQGFFVVEAIQMVDGLLNGAALGLAADAAIGIDYAIQSGASYLKS